MTVFAYCFVFVNNVSAQDDIRQKIETMPYYSYRKGMGITSSDSIYQFNIRFRIQNRATFIKNNDDKSSVDGQIRRLRLRFDGYVGNPKFTYLFQLSFAPGDVGEVEEGKDFNVIRDAVVFYEPNNKWTFGFGQTKLPGNRQRFNSSGGLQLTDRSINNSRFNIDRDFGFQVYRLNQFKNKFSYNVKAAVSMGEGRNFTENNDANLAYTAKLELYPFGSFSKSGEYFEGDILREEKPKLMISGAFHFNNKAKNSQGQTGSALYAPKDMQSIFGDIIYKHKGFSFMSAFMQRKTSNPIAVNPHNPTEFNYVYIGTGMDYQSSYMFKNHYEIIGRYSWQNVDKRIFQYTPNTKQLTLGLTKYIWEHAFKLQAEATYNIENYYNNSKKNNWYFRLQTEIGI